VQKILYCNEGDRKKKPGHGERRGTLPREPREGRTIEEPSQEAEESAWDSAVVGALPRREKPRQSPVASDEWLSIFLEPRIARLVYLFGWRRKNGGQRKNESLFSLSGGNLYKFC
jgi:hypothetical protein